MSRMALTRAELTSGQTAGRHGARGSLTSRFLDQSLYVALVPDADPSRCRGTIPLQRLATPEDIGDTCLYLASPLTVAASAFAGRITAYRPGMFQQEQPRTP